MKLFAINGSPRKDWNTATLIKSALEGAASVGAETELIHLYDYNYKGCISCFACKLKNRKSYGKCEIKDELTAVLNKTSETDALLLGAPIYLGAVNSMMQAFFERLIFPIFSYGSKPTIDQKKEMYTAYIYTLGATEERMKLMGYDRTAGLNEILMKNAFGNSEYLIVNDTYQFDDYSKYETSGINVQHKTKRRNEVFPEDCKNAFDLGVRLVQHNK